MKPSEAETLAYAEKVIKLAQATCKTDNYTEVFDLLLFSAIIALHEGMHTGELMCCTKVLKAVASKINHMTLMSAFAELQGGNVDFPRTSSDETKH